MATAPGQGLQRRIRELEEFLFVGECCTLHELLRGQDETPHSDGRPPPKERRPFFVLPITSFIVATGEPIPKEASRYCIRTPGRQWTGEGAG